MRKTFAPKILAGILMCALISCGMTALAWEDSDIIYDGGNEIIVPLQVPDIKLGSAFSPDSAATDHNGNTGNVYTGKVGISKTGQQTVMATLENYRFNEGKYKLSLWFKEFNTNPKSDENPDGADNMTRMIRPESGGQTVKQGGAYLFFADKPDKIVCGEWKYAELEFSVDDENNKFLIGGAPIEMKWNCADRWDTVAYDDRNKNADYYVSFSDIKLFKYPAGDLSLIKTNSGGEKCADALKFEAEFSVPVDVESIKTIMINGKESSAELFDIICDENTLKISPANGFAPLKSYEISVNGITDIFGRKFDGTVSGKITALDYLDVSYNGISDGKLNIKVKNNMSENADFVAAVFYYKDNNVKQVFYSDDIKDLLPGETKNIEIPVADNLTSFKIKTQLWNLSGEIPSPISGEIFADSTENADL